MKQQSSAQEPMKERENIIRKWFSMWLNRQDTGITEIFAPDCIYIESWGPRYDGVHKVALWFNEWNTRGKVNRWDIHRFFHSGDRTVVEWTFSNRMRDGTVESFDGLSLVKWDADNRIAYLREYGSNTANYDPYREGSFPVFKEESSKWF